MSNAEWVAILAARDRLMLQIALGTIGAALNYYVWPGWVKEILVWLGVILVAVTVSARLMWR